MCYVQFAPIMLPFAKSASCSRLAGFVYVFPISLFVRSVAISYYKYYLISEVFEVSN